MNNLVNIIKYEDEDYAAVNDAAGKKMIDDLAAKLKTIEDKIFEHEAADININASGNVFVKNLPTELKEAIQEIVVQG